MGETRKSELIKEAIKKYPNITVKNSNGHVILLYNGWLVQKMSCTGKGKGLSGEAFWRVLENNIRDNSGFFLLFFIEIITYSIR